MIIDSWVFAINIRNEYFFKFSRGRDWRYPRGNQNPEIEEEQTTQRPKEKGQKDKQRSATHTHIQYNS